MAETQELDRPVSRTAAVDPRVRPRVGWRTRRLFRSVNLWFWGIVGLPTLLAGVYFFAIASDLYSSEAKFIVRSPKAVQASGIGVLLQSTGLTRAYDDTAAVQ